MLTSFYKSETLVHNDEETDLFLTSEVQKSSSTLDEARNDQEVESLRLDKDTSDGDSQYDTDLEEDFLRNFTSYSK